MDYFPTSLSPGDMNNRIEWITYMASHLQGNLQVGPCLGWTSRLASFLTGFLPEAREVLQPSSGIKWTEHRPWPAQSDAVNVGCLLVAGGKVSEEFYGFFWQNARECVLVLASLAPSFKGKKHIPYLSLRYSTTVYTNTADVALRNMVQWWTW